MAQGTGAHFANRAPLRGTRSRNHFRLGEWKIGTFLTACFAAIVLLMVVGDVIAVLQLDRVETRAWRFYQADQKSLAIMHVYLDVVTFRDTLTGLAHEQNPHEFASRATALRDNFLTDVTHAQGTLSSPPDVSQDPTILIRLETVRAALPSQVDTLLELVKVEDWQAVRLRLAGQVPPLLGLCSSLVADVEREVGQERARALESVQRTRRQLYLVLPITALLMLLMATMLGGYATHRISRPLTQLDAGAQALARGEFGYQVELRGNDELADLARAFNYAAQQLHKLYDVIKCSEAHLAESKAKLEEAQRITHVGYWEWDLITNGVTWSDETYRIYGLRPQECPMDLATVREKIHPEDWEVVSRALEEALRGGARYTAESRLFRPTGEVRIVQSQGDVKRDTSGRPIQMFGTVQDITDRKRAEEALQQSQFYLVEGQRLAHMGSWGFEPAGFFDYWSRELFQIYGLDPAKEPPSLEEYLASIHPQDCEFMRSLINRMIAEATGCDVTKRIVRPNGDIRFVRCVGVPVVENGKLKKIVGTAIDVTEYELMTRELRRREAYLAEAQRLSHTGSFGWKPDTGEIVWSAETYRIFEYDPAVKPTIDLLVQRVHPEDRPDFLKVIESASAGATQFEHTYRWLQPDGTVKHVHALAHALQDASGKREFVGAATDVTSIKRAEEELRTSEAYLAEAQRLSQTGSWAWNPVTGDIRYWSEECYRVLGFDPHGPPPRFETFFQRIHRADQVAMRERFEKAIRDKADFELDYRIIHPSRGIRDIHAVARAVLGRSGDLVEFVGTVIDVTERKRAEEELRQLVDWVPQLIVVLGPDGKWIHANRVAREYTGLRLDEYRSVDVIGRVIHPDDAAGMRAVSERAFLENGPFELEARLLGKDGAYRWFLFRYNPLVEQGCVKRWYATATEIESRKQEEERIRKENVRLEERTRIAQELHDTLLQTFLSASMQLSVALDGVPPDSLVKPGLDRILRIMNQGIEEGRNTIQELRSSDSSTLDLVVALSGVQQELAVQPDVDFRVVVAGRQQPMRPAIRHEIYRIGREALVNAFRHSRATRVEVVLEYADSELRMKVRDNGCGVDPRVLDAGREGHWGLAGMQERATRIGGLLKISSNATAGTEVQLSIPSGIAFQLSPADRLAKSA
jgi:PAS domain S-box-containing protein